MKEKINYIIATWSGDRIANTNVLYYENVLKNHLKILNNTSNSIDQITIMKPRNDIKNTYYDIDSELTDKMKIIECENKYQSYGQWMTAVKLYIDDFDYFIFIEDDYVPASDNFDRKLIDIYKEDTFLSTSVNMPDNVGHYLCHSLITNGIISKATIEKIILTVDYDEWFRRYGELYPKRICFGGNYQIAFSRYLQENNITLKEFGHLYRAEFHDRNNIIDFRRPSASNERIFAPIQVIIKDE